MSDENQRAEGATRGDETDPPSYWLIGHWLGSLYWGPRWGMDCEGNAARFPTVVEAYEQWKRLPAELRRSLVLAPSWRKLRTEGATDTPETAQRGCDGKVADGEHSVAAVEFAVRALDEVLPGLRSETAPQQERALDTWYLYLAVEKPVYLGDGGEVWWTKSKASARKFASAGEARGVFDRLHPSSLGGKLYICCDPGPPRVSFEQALRTEGATCTKRDEVLSASVDERGSLTVHLATDDKGNVVSAMSEVRAAIEATGSRKMEPEENGMKKNLRTDGANAPVREDGTTWLLWHKHDNSYLGRPGGFDEEGLATHFASQAEAEQFRDEHVSQRLRNVVVAVPRPKQKLCVEDAPTRPSEPSLRVVAAAVWHEEMIYSLPRPARHHNILHKLHELGLPAAVGGPYSSLEQGFLLSDGTFVGRALAAAIAVAAGQVQKLTAPPELYSEDLW